MIVSCLCPTFGRCPAESRLLSECVESFVRQLPIRGVRAELLILNDHPAQTLSCEAPGVRVVNLPERLPTLGEKYNAMVNEALGSVLLPWEDDDVSLPGRIRQAIASILSGHSYFNPGGHWCLYAGKTTERPHRNVVGHNASAYTREAWHRAGGYPPVSGPQDLLMDQRLRALKETSPPLDLADPLAFQYIYRWGFSHNHLSGNKDTTAAWAAEGERQVEPGSFAIVPEWRADYIGLCRHSLLNGA